MSYSNSDRFYRDRMSSSCSLKSEESDFEMDDDRASFTNSSSGFSRMNSTYSSSTYSLNDKRRSRNQNEKKRRDQFNLLIQELGNLLNHPRKIDKATVLNETLFFFRNYNEKPLYNKEIEFKYKPFFLQNDEFMRFMIEFQNSFCLVFDLNGDIKYVSDDIIHLMGYFPKNLQDCSLYDFLDEKSAKKLRTYLKRKFNPQDPIDIDCRFKKINDTNGGYESIKIKGFFKRTPNSVDSLGHFNTLVQLDCFMSINELYPRDNNKREFKTEFSMDLKYTSLDSKAFEIIGYSAIEMIGTCGYDYCHLDDLEKLIDCHKKLLQNGAVPIIAYRFRTKGLQWLWIQSRFQIMYHQTAMKPYAIISYNHVIGLNEMVESKDLLDVKAFYSNESTISLAADNETKQDDTKDPQWTNNPIQNSNNQETKNVDLVNMSSNKHEIKPDKHIDESLGSIFLRSFNDIDYRNYVLNQFKMKKQKIENTIRQHQEELNILEETMDNIRDEKKLASWVMEFQRQEYNNNLYKNVSNKSQKSDQQSESSSSKETQQNQQPIRNNQNQLQHNQQQQQHRQSYPPNEQLMIQTNQYQDQHKIDKNIQSKTSTLLIQKQQQGNNERNFNMKSEYTDAMENNQIMSSNKSAKRAYSSSPQSSRNANFNEEAELVGELISIRKTMPKSFNENKTVNQRDFNNNNNTTTTTTTTTITTTNNNVKNRNQLRLKNNISLSNLQSSMEFEDMNSEMIDKLLNNYNFETFTDQ